MVKDQVQNEVQRGSVGVAMGKELPLDEDASNRLGGHQCCGIVMFDRERSSQFTNLSQGAADGALRSKKGPSVGVPEIACRT